MIPLIPVVDLFAGPGGLSEGFNSFKDEKGKSVFKITLSIEKEEYAYQTLLLRSFFRQFDSNRAPEMYYKYLRGEISKAELYTSFPDEIERARGETLKKELGNHQFSRNELNQRINEAVKNRPVWILIGGPPCQAYSIAGRSRMRSVDKESFDIDERHFLYKEYLSVLSELSPPIFLLESVKGLISSTIKGVNFFEKIFDDLENPRLAQGLTNSNHVSSYKIYNLAESSPVNNKPYRISKKKSSDFVVKSERHLIPQARHRVFLLGVKTDFDFLPVHLKIHEKRVALCEVISDLPKIRSKLSKNIDKNRNWLNAVKSALNSDWFKKELDDVKLKSRIKEVIDLIELYAKDFIPTKNGSEFTPGNYKPNFNRDWYHDRNLDGICNHTARGHIIPDLHRYLFSSCFAELNNRSPNLKNYPKRLLPNHHNVKEGIKEFKFTDRFKVQLLNQPSSTITSHISKDGHYFIHPDPFQCRSLTVREAARLQTFPDNYFFEGPRTSQYQQVGNAVPPLMAREIAGIIRNILSKIN